MSALTAWVSVTTEDVDAAEIRVQASSGSPGYVAAWEVGGLHHQTFYCDPAEVAAAYRRLADRIDAATVAYLEHLDSQAVGA